MCCDQNDSFHGLEVEFEKAEAVLSINLIQLYGTEFGLKLREKVSQTSTYIKNKE